MTFPTPRRLRVMVLMGGSSSERDISLSTGKMILSALDPDKYDVAAIDTQDLLCLAAPAPPSLPVGPDTHNNRDIELDRHEDKDGEAKRSNAILPGGSGNNLTLDETPRPLGTSSRPDIVFIALHGKGGEDGAVQGMLEMLGIPYTGSGVLASALAMDKAMTKRLLRTAGIPVIADMQIRRGQLPDAASLIEQVERSLGGFPIFVKPNAEGSTFGCSLVNAAEELAPAVETALRYDALALIEKYMRGIEITVGVLGNAAGPTEALPVIEIVPKGVFYDYESKYAAGGSDHIIPARIPEAQLRQAQQIALRCHELLGCRGMSRTDMIVSGDQLCVLEINTIPGMTPTSLLPQAAAHAGISFTDLLDRLIGYALSGQ